MNATFPSTAIWCESCGHTIAHRFDVGPVEIGGRHRPVTLAAGRAHVTCWHEVYDGNGPPEHPAWRVCNAVNVVTATEPA